MGKNLLPSVKGSLAEISTLLTTRSEAAGVLRYNPSAIAEKRELIEKLIKTLAQHADVLANQLGKEADGKPRAWRDHWESIKAAADAADERTLDEYGVAFGHAWPKDIITTIIRGGMPVEIQAFYLNKYDAASAPLCVAMAGIVNDIRRLCPKVQPVMYIEDCNHEDGSAASALESEQRTIEAVSLLENAGIISKDSTPGEDYILVRQSTSSKHLVDLIQQLRRSPHGQLIIDKDGSMYFKPSVELVDLLGLRSKARYIAFTTQGILLKDADGNPTAHALDAASYVSNVEHNSTTLHVIVSHTLQAVQMDSTYALLRALKIVRSERSHTILVDPRILSPDVIAYIITRSFEKAARQVLLDLQQYNEWGDFDAYEYASRNYHNGGTILPEDIEIIREVILAFKQLGLTPGSLRHAADVGTGPNLYPAMLLSPYMAAHSTIELLEFSPSNRSYLTKVIDGTIHGVHARLWHKFEEYMASIGGQLYDGCEADAKKLVRPQFGDIFALPKQKYELVTSYFCAESIVDSHMPFRLAIQSLRDTLKPDGILIVAHMVESEGYHAGEGTHFPALPLTLDQIKQAYLDADLEIIAIKKADGKPEQRLRDSAYHGMAIVIAQSK